MKRLLILIVPFLLASCGNGNDKADAYGNFEAVETVISSKANGEIKELKVDEGDVVKKGMLLLQCDTTDLVLQKKQLVAQKKAVLANLDQVKANLDVLKQNIDGAETDRNRIEKLFADGAATQKQKDDIENIMNDVNQKN